MIKAIIFDFDGVIVESAEIKTKAFGKLFEQDYPEKVATIVDYHMQNAGISRYVKFRYIYNNILKLPLSETQEQYLGRKFSEIVLEEVLSAPFVPGAKEFLVSHCKEYYLIIASGTPEDELHDIVARRQIGFFFREMHGSPKRKSEIIRDVLERYALNKDQVVFVGDAVSDQVAAKETGVNFIMRISSESNQEIQDCQWKVNDLTELSAILKSMEQIGNNTLSNKQAWHKG